MIKKILVPIDGSKPADKALDMAIKIAKEERGKIVLLHVIESRPLIFGPYPYAGKSGHWIGGYPGYIYPSQFPEWAIEYNKNIQEYSSDYFTRIIEQLKMGKGEKVNLSYKIVPGKAAEKILEVAMEEEFDLIVMGSTGIGSIGRFLMVPQAVV